MFKDGYADRLKTAAEAKAALLAKFKPQEARPATEAIDRKAEQAEALRQVREERAQAKAAKQDAVAAGVAAQAQAIADGEAADLEAKRGKTRERKALSAAESKAKRDAKYAARQARR